jgi:mRNA interferase RelE/StbE
MRIEWKKSTRKDPRRLPSADVDRILAAEPFPAGVDKIAGSDHAYRIRIGDYRVIYEVLPRLDLIEVQRVRHRKDVYR